MKTDIIIVGSGAAGLYCALNLPAEKKITIVTKNKARRSDSYLAQGGICVLRDEKDYDAFYEDTMKAGHYENNPDSVHIMIHSSREVISDLVSFGVRFEKDGEKFTYTREGAHSNPRILFHEDETGKEITSHLLDTARNRENITIIENYTMVDIICDDNECFGIIGHDADGVYSAIQADYTVLATGGIGGVFEHSTNYKHLTGDAIALALKYGIKLQHIDYIQIHPTTLYTEKDGREFLISESVRGEGAILLNSKGERFVNELLPRDVVANAIFAEMKKEGSRHVWLSMAPIPEGKLKHTSLTFISVVWKKVMTQLRNLFRLFRPSTTLWAVSMLTDIVKHLWTVYMRQVRRPATAYTAGTVWQVTRCLKALCLQKEQQRTL